MSRSPRQIRDPFGLAERIVRRAKCHEQQNGDPTFDGQGAKNAARGYTIQPNANETTERERQKDCEGCHDRDRYCCHAKQP